MLQLIMLPAMILLYLTAVQNFPVTKWTQHLSISLRNTPHLPRPKQAPTRTTAPRTETTLYLTTNDSLDVTDIDDVDVSAYDGSDHATIDDNSNNNDNEDAAHARFYELLQSQLQALAIATNSQLLEIHLFAAEHDKLHDSEDRELIKVMDYAAPTLHNDAHALQVLETFGEVCTACYYDQNTVHGPMLTAPLRVGRERFGILRLIRVPSDSSSVGGVGGEGALDSINSIADVEVLLQQAWHWNDVCTSTSTIVDQNNDDNDNLDRADGPRVRKEADVTRMALLDSMSRTLSLVIGSEVERLRVESATEGLMRYYQTMYERLQRNVFSGVQTLRTLVKIVENRLKFQDAIAKELLDNIVVQVDSIMHAVSLQDNLPVELTSTNIDHFESSNPTPSATASDNSKSIAAEAHSSEQSYLSDSINTVDVTTSIDAVPQFDVQWWRASKQETEIFRDERNQSVKASTTSGSKNKNKNDSIKAN